MYSPTQTPANNKTSASPSAWRMTAVTAALGVLLSAAHLNANALGLGAITALSALGEPFVAGIAVPEITPDEYATLKVTLASPDGYRAAGMDYNAALASAQFALNRRPDGSVFLMLRSDKAVSDPFVNLVVNANWAGGRIVRNYTLLLDPPATRQADPNTITAPITSLTPANTIAPRAPTAVAAAAPMNQTSPQAPMAVAPKEKPFIQEKPLPTAKTTPTRKTPLETRSADKNSNQTHKVASGETAGKIAANLQPANVSLEQVLVAMLRANPNAFIGNNVNRLKTGAVLTLPSNEDAQAVSATEARQSIVAQTKDFNSFKRKLAENAPTLAAKAPDRQSSGKVEAKVDDNKASNATPDKLTLSKGALKAGEKDAAKDASEKIAKDKQAKDDANRLAELSKNISDLNKAAATVPAAGAAVAASAPNAAPAPSEKSTTPSVTVTAPLVSGATGTPTAAPTKTAPAVAATPAKPAAVPAAVAETSFVDDLLDNPAVLPAAGGLLALLAAGGLYLSRKRKAQAALDDEDAAPEFENPSFFNTRADETQATQSLAAEPYSTEPFKSAKPIAPNQPSVTLPTAPVAAAVAAVTAVTATAVQHEQHRSWAAESTPVVAPVAKHVELKEEIADNYPAFTQSEFSQRTVAQLHPETAKSPAPVDLNLDFDVASRFPSFDTAAPIAASAKPTVANITSVPTTIATATAATNSNSSSHSTNLLDFDMPSLATAPSMAVAAVAAPVKAAAAHIAPLEFNLDNLSLDLNAANKPGAGNTINDLGPLETKLALAQEFKAIGDARGAKMLAQEVIDLASGSLKIKAETLLKELG